MNIDQELRAMAMRLARLEHRATVMSGVLRAMFIAAQEDASVPPQVKQILSEVIDSGFFDDDYEVRPGGVRGPSA